MKKKLVRIATRQSPLALWQANHVGSLLKQHWPMLDIELVPLVTSGDTFLQDKLIEAGGKGLFVKELEEALLDNRADIAVHSTKDMPAQYPDGLCLPVICKRDNPFDAFVSIDYAQIDELPLHAVVGTSSLRRQAQLLAYRPDLNIKILRGNVNTRLNKLEQGEYHAIILAVSGLERLGLNRYISEIISDKLMLPACGQGALSIECREDDSPIQSLIAPLNDPDTSLCVLTERMVNQELGGSCQTPLAIFCHPASSQELILKTKVLSPDGTKVLYEEQKGAAHQSSLLVQNTTQSLLQKGAAALLGIQK